MNGLRICEGLWVTFFAIWLIFAFRTKPTQTRESVSSRLSYTLISVAAFYLTFSEDVSREWLRLQLFPLNIGWEMLGVVITATGLSFAVWARVYLGSNWSSAVTVKVGHQLIRTGPYRWVRHPIYSGMILGMLGTALEWGQVRGFVGVGLLYFAFKIKSKIEEHTMSNTFGAEYAEYSRSTGAIVPKLRF